MLARRVVGRHGKVAISATTVVWKAILQTNVLRLYAAVLAEDKATLQENVQGGR